MSVRIPITDLSKEQIANIKKLVFNADKGYLGGSGDSIPLYEVEGKEVIVPFMEGVKMMNKFINDKIKYPKHKFDFTGKLLQRQVDVDASAWEHMKHYGTSTLSLRPGFGKTVLGAHIAVRTGLLTVVVMYRTTLLCQWVKTFTKFTNAKIWNVGEEQEPAEYDVIICLSTRWNKIAESTRLNVGFMIMDEAHAMCTKTGSDCILAFQPKYVLAETATLERDDKLHEMIHAVCGKHEVSREIDVGFTVIKTLTGFQPTIEKGPAPGKMWGKEVTKWNVVLDSTIRDSRRNELILEIVKKNPKRNIIVLTARSEHTQFLCDKIQEFEPSCNTFYGKADQYDDCRILVGNTQKIGTGFDAATSCRDFGGKNFDTLILACSFRQKASLIQNVGRVFRSDNPVIFQLVDDHRILDTHWKEARKWYDKVGGLVKIWDLSDCLT